MALTYAAAVEWLSEIGADLSGVVTSAEWAEYLPPEMQGLPHRAILIFGAGGPDFVHRCHAHAAEHGEQQYWLADYAQWLFERWHGGPSPRFLNPYRTGLSVPFQRLTVAAGLGVKGLNHVVLTREWGPWFSLLGALVLDEAVAPTTGDGFDPCNGCAAPCLKACPSGAVTAERYDGMLCIETKVTHRPCLHACPARQACVVRADLRPAMVKLEAARRRDDEETRVMLRKYLERRDG